MLTQHGFVQLWIQIRTFHKLSQNKRAVIFHYNQFQSSNYYCNSCYSMKHEKIFLQSPDSIPICYQGRHSYLTVYFEVMAHQKQDLKFCYIRCISSFHILNHHYNSNLRFKKTLEERLQAVQENFLLYRNS